MSEGAELPRQNLRGRNPRKVTVKSAVADQFLGSPTVVRLNIHVDPDGLITTALTPDEAEDLAVMLQYYAQEARLDELP